MAGMSWRFVVDGQDTLGMPVTFRRTGQVVNLGDAQARSVFGDWLRDRAGEVAIFGTIGMSFGQAAPALTLHLDQPPAP